jgi:hypothetical protein
MFHPVSLLGEKKLLILENMIVADYSGDTSTVENYQRNQTVSYFLSHLIL